VLCTFSFHAIVPHSLTCFVARFHVALVLFCLFANSTQQETVRCWPSHGGGEGAHLRGAVHVCIPFQVAHLEAAVSQAWGLVLLAARRIMYVAAA